MHNLQADVVIWVSGPTFNTWQPSGSGVRGLVTAENGGS
jgi:hypothetical protein